MSDPAEPTVFAGAGPIRRPGRDATLIAGDLLNGIYKVERFIARGGMGEVFEGVNIETEERVAIKAIRSHLASDPKVVALFRKEARVLTQFAHPAIVQYRVFARDPLIDLHYIVTDFIDGDPITAHLDGTVQDIHDVVILARRLATGLDVAHDHGAIHRDMSPDNVLLPHRKLDSAKIIDFGIAKSLDLVTETVVGDGFAGKLGYVAPEQFGDFDRQVGPWTDVYSTALVLLAYACGKAPGMGTTLSEAVERRRLGPANIEMPPALAPLIERMLVPDPVARIRSMREVLAGLDSIRLPDTPAVLVRTVAVAARTAPPDKDIELAAEGEGRRRPDSTMTTFVPPAAHSDATVPISAAPKPARKAWIGLRDRRRRWALILAPLAVAAVGGSFAVFRAPEPPTAMPAPKAPQRSPAKSVAASRLPAAHRAFKIDALLAHMPCTWVTARPATDDGATMLSGGSGDPAAVGARLAGNVRELGQVDTRGIHAVNAAQCGAIDLLRPFRAVGAARKAEMLMLSSSRAVLGTGGPGCEGGATLEMTAQYDDPARDFALLALQPDGRLLQIAGSRAEFRQLAKRDAARYDVGPDGTYHASVCYTLAGPSAILLVDSKGTEGLGLRTGIAALPTPEFRRSFAEQGRGHEVRVSTDWTWIDGPSVAAASLPASPSQHSASQPGGMDKAPRPELVVRGERTRLQPAIDAADANRRELERIRAFPSVRSGVDVGLCRTFDKSWKTIGQLARDECVSRGFERKCEVAFAMHQDRLFRRNGKYIEEQRGHRWRKVARSFPC